MIKNILFVTSLFFAASVIAQVEIYAEDFQTGFPSAMTIIDNDGFTPNAAVSNFGDAWIILADPDNPTDSIAGSTSYFEPVGQADRWLITPAITIGAYGNVLYWNAKSHDPSFPDDYMILISKTTPDLASFTDTLYNIVNELATWQARSVNMSDSGFVSETIYIAFVNRTNNGFKLYLDDIRVEKEDPVGISENKMNSFAVYPNPARNIIHLTGVSPTEKVIIYSVDGQIVLTTTASSIDISSLENGKYFIESKINGISTRAQFIKI